MTALAGPFYVFALLLIAAGVLKMIDPRATAGALNAAGLPSRFVLVRVLGGLEIVIGAGAFASGSASFAAALAAAYLTFAVFIVVARMRNLPVASCGCFGKDDTPPSLAHVVLTGVASAVGGVLTFDPIGPVVDVVESQPWAGVPFLGATLVATYLTYVILTDLARTMSIVSDGSKHSRGVPMTRDAQMRNTPT